MGGGGGNMDSEFGKIVGGLQKPLAAMGTAFSASMEWGGMRRWDAWSRGFGTVFSALRREPRADGNDRCLLRQAVSSLFLLFLATDYAPPWNDSINSKPFC